MIALLLLGLLAAEPARPGLVAWYRFESLESGRLADDSGQGNHLLAKGGLSLAPGRVGQAVAVSGAGYPQAPASPSLELGGELTLEAWIRPSRHPASGMRIVDRQTPGGNEGFMFDTWPSGHLRLIIAPTVLRDSEPLPLDRWVHVAATWSETAGEARLYRDGQVVAAGYAAGRLKPSAHPLNIGASQGGGDRFDGLIDEVRIWSRALAPEELAAHAEGREISPPADALGQPLKLPVITAPNAEPPALDPVALAARNDLVYRQPATYPFEAMRLGNGRLGVSLWNEGGLTWQLNHGRYRRANEPLSSGRATLTMPGLADQPFEQRLSLANGTVSTTAGGTAVTTLVTGEDVVMVRARSEVAGPRTLTLHLWPARTAAKFVEGDGFVALTEHSDHAESFLPTDLALRVSLDGAPVKVVRRDERTLALTWEQPGEVIIYLANAVGRGGEEAALAAAAAQTEAVRARGWERSLAAITASRRTFWDRSFVHLSSRNGEAELLENLWYLYFHDLAGMAAPDTLCPKFNGGNYLSAEDQRHWGGGYWHQNTRELFWPTYAAGHVELGEPFFELYGRAAAVARESGRNGLGVDGFYIPEWIPINVAAARSRKDFSRPGYTAFIFTVALEVALQGWWRYEYTGDEMFLREQVYPLLKGALDFYLGYARRGADGFYHVDPADAQESYWLVRDPAQDLAALRWAIPVALRVSEKLLVDSELRPRWRELLDHLAPFSVDPDKKLIREADLAPDAVRHNWENVANYSIWPFGVFGPGRPDYELAKSTFANRPIQGMGNGWEPAAIVAARLGLADEAAKLMMAHLQANLRTSAGGWYSPTSAVFVNNIPDSPYYDAAGVFATALQEMLLQSQDGVIRLAPAWPAKWVARFKLHARGGFVVTAETFDGRPRYALIESTRGGPCRVANPWSESLVVRRGGVEIARSAAEEVEFPTAPGAVYLLERLTEPLAAMESGPLVAKPADGPKFAGRLPAWPNWHSPLYLGLDAQGHSPQRAALERNLAAAARRLSEATAGLRQLSATCRPALGGELPPGQAIIVELGAAQAVQALTFSRDRSGLRLDGTPGGYVVELSDGTTWTQVADRPRGPVSAAGTAERLAAPRVASAVRLTLHGANKAPVRLDQLAVWGP